MFDPITFFGFHDLKPNQYFFVGEKKSLPAREARSDTDAIGRSLVGCWFEKVEATTEGVIDQRVDRAAPHINMMLCTLAELPRAAGYNPPARPNDTARAVEIALESSVFDHNVLRYAHRRLQNEAHADAYTFLLHEPADAEQVFWTKTALSDMTKMALARRLEVMHGVNRLDAWRSMNKASLMLAADPTFVAPAPPAPVAPKAKGVGPKGKGHKGQAAKGKGAKAKAKGKGNRRR